MAAAQVRKAGRKAGESHGVLAARVALHHFIGGDAQNLRHLGQVFAVVMHGDFDQRVAALGALRQAARSNVLHQGFGPGGRGAVLHQNGPRSGDQLLHAVGRMPL